MERSLRRFLPTDNAIRALLVPVLVFIATAIDRNYQTDLWHHLARGRAIVAEHRLLNEDRFTYTIPGRPFRDSNWGWQVLSYRLYEAGGLKLVQTVNALTLALMMVVLLDLCRRRSGSVTAAAGVCLVVFLGLWQLFLIRPQTFSLLLFVVLYALLEGALRRRWLLVFAPVVMALWANLHGGFPVGLALIGCYVLAAALTPEPGVALVRRVTPWALGLVASIAATLVNPYGIDIYRYVGVTSGLATVRKIDEWLPPGLDMLIGKVWVVSLLLMVGLAAWPRRPAAAQTGGTPVPPKQEPRRQGFHVRELCLIACFLPAACGSVRMVAWWLLISAPILAVQVTALWPGLRRLDSEGRQPSAGAAWLCGFALAAALLSLPWLERFNPVLALPGRGHRTETDLQTVADRLAQQGTKGRIFTRFAWGEYLGWSLNPRYTVFMDGRIEIFPDEVWTQYAAITRGRADWQQILDGYGVDYLLLDTTGYHHDLLPQVERSGTWHEVLRQGDAVLFARGGKSAEVAARDGRRCSHLRQSPQRKRGQK